jgi:hypothetical protein
MQSLLTKAVAIALVVLATPQSRANTSVSARANERIVRDFDSLDRDGQRSYLQSWLVDRFDQAASVALSKTEREKRSQRYTEVLKRIAAGKSLSKGGLSRLIAEIVGIERQAIDQLSLQYRVLIYDRFRTERAEYDRRMALWRQMMGAWESADTRVSEGTKVIGWLTTTLDRMRDDQWAMMPPTPKFGESTVSQFAAKPKSSEVNLPSLMPTTPTSPPHTTAPPTVKLPAMTAKPSAVGKPTSKLRAAPRLVHRVDKPPIPEVSPPPRTILREVRPTVAPLKTPPTLDELDTEPRAMIDLDELAVRVRGYNLALKEFTGNLQDEKVWTTGRLADVLDELSDLAERRAQLMLYRDLISGDEQKQVSELMSLDTPVALLGAKIFATREQLSQATEDGDPAAIAALNELSRKLALLAAKRAK